MVPSVRGETTPPISPTGTVIGFVTVIPSWLNCMTSVPGAVLAEVPLRMTLMPFQTSTSVQDPVKTPAALRAAVVLLPVSTVLRTAGEYAI